MRALLGVGILLATLHGASAQAPRNGDVYGGEDHQPTKAEVTHREDRAGVELPPAASRQDTRSIDQLGQQLLHDEAVDPPQSPPQQSPPQPAAR